MIFVYFPNGKSTRTGGCFSFFCFVCVLFSGELLSKSMNMSKFRYQIMFDLPLLGVKLKLHHASGQIDLLFWREASGTNHQACNHFFRDAYV